MLLIVFLHQVDRQDTIGKCDYHYISSRRPQSLKGNVLKAFLLNYAWFKWNQRRSGYFLRNRLLTFRSHEIYSEKGKKREKIILVTTSYLSSYLVLPKEVGNRIVMFQYFDNCISNCTQLSIDIIIMNYTTSVPGPIEHKAM